MQAEEELLKNEKIIRKICAIARSNKSKGQIESDFIAGIRDMHRKANGRDDDDDDNDRFDVDDDDENSDEAFFASKAGGFKVFSVSSSDYLKLKGLKSGQSNVFEDIADTGVEDLVESSRSLSERRAVEEVGKNLERMQRLVLNCGSYLRTKSLDDVDTRKKAAGIFAEKMTQLDFSSFSERLEEGVFFN